MTTTRTEAEAFQIYLTKEVANGGKFKSPEELVAAWRREQGEREECIAAVKASLDEIARGEPLTPIEDVIAEIRQQHGWTK